jgi:hypothetical protein
MVAACAALLLVGCAVSPDDTRLSAAAEAPAACPALPAVLPVSIPVAGGHLAGTLYLAPGGGRGATIAWFHGFPGLPAPDPQLVTAVTAAGLNLLYLHYRGTWGNAGAFGAASALKDGAAALAFLRDPAAADACRVDADAIVAVGDSFGSWVAMQAAARDPRVRCAAGALLLDLGTLGAAADDAAVRAGFVDMFSAVDADPELGFELQGGAEGLMGELMASHRANALANAGPALADRPILLVGAGTDELAPPAHHLRPFADALAAAGAGNVTVRMFPGGHELADVDYAAVLVQWIGEECRDVERSAPQAGH